MAPFLFAGPSLLDSNSRQLDTSFVRLKPPAKRGDIDLLLNEEDAAGTIILADGRFHSELAVGHSELRRAIRAGWEIWGVSSMGAIRACEMRSTGMKGFGVIYGFFMDDPDFADDEVALLHIPDPPYHAVSEPLVHTRMFLRYPGYV